jgi:hypothetical protein
MTCGVHIFGDLGGCVQPRRSLFGLLFSLHTLRASNSVRRFRFAQRKQICLSCAACACLFSRLDVLGGRSAASAGCGEGTTRGLPDVIARPPPVRERPSAVSAPPTDLLFPRPSPLASPKSSRDYQMNCAERALAGGGASASPAPRVFARPEKALRARP